MKTPLTYGFLGALGGAIVNLLLYFTGFHDSAEKLSTAQWVGGLVGLAITITCLSLALRDKRAQAPAESNWGYGSAFGNALLTSLFMVLFGAISTYVYFALINPGFTDIIYAAQVAKLEAQGKSATEIANAEPIMRKFISPVVSTIFQAVFGLVFCTIISAIVAIFFRKPREGVVDAPPISA